MIIDANVFKGYFESTMTSKHSLSRCPVSLFAQFSAATPIYHDAGKIIESEWQHVVDREWFEPWLATQLMEGAIAYVETVRDMELEKKLTAAGFPVGRDIVYVRVGLGVVRLKGTGCTLFTEDMDFYDPTQKKCASKTRTKLLAAASGPVCKILKKRGITVSSVP